MSVRILTVEDDERIRTAVSLALQEEGWEVEETSNGEDALASFSRQPSDVVLIDIMLPGIDGFEVCRKIRRFAVRLLWPVFRKSWQRDWAGA